MRAVLVVACAVVTAAGARAFTPPSAADVDARVRAPWRGGIDERLVDVTEPFLDAPYVLSPLGEGEGQDPDPRLRFDAFDCTTFVETALALALGNDLDDSRRILDRLRYRGGGVSFLERRHFPEAEWIPDLVRAGLLRDITREVADPACARARGDAACAAGDVTRETKALDARVWRRARHKGLPDLPDERIPSGVFGLDVWRLDAAARHAERIPPGTVLHLVRVDFASVPVRVSHQGLVIEKNGRRFLRHAADRMHHRVVDEPLDRFFRRMKQYGRWPVAGVHLTLVDPAADWRARLGVPAPSASAP